MILFIASIASFGGAVVALLLTRAQRSALVQATCVELIQKDIGKSEQHAFSELQRLEAQAESKDPRQQAEARTKLDELRNDSHMVAKLMKLEQTVLQGLRSWAAALAAGGVLLLVASCTYFVPAGYVAVPVLLGTSRAPRESGLHWSWPLAEWNLLSVRDDIYLLGRSSAPEGVASDGPLMVTTRDLVTASIEATITFRLSPREAKALFDRVGPAFPAEEVHSLMRSAIRLAASSMTAREIAHCPGFATETMNKMLEIYGIEVVAVGVHDVRFSDQVRDSIEKQFFDQTEAAAAPHKDAGGPAPASSKDKDSQ